MGTTDKQKYLGLKALAKQIDGDHVSIFPLLDELNIPKTEQQNSFEKPVS